MSNTSYYPKRISSCMSAVVMVLSIGSSAWTDQPSRLSANVDAAKNGGARRSQLLVAEHCDAAREELRSLDERLAKLREEVQELLAELQTLESVPKPAHAELASKTKRVVYRPPIERLTRRSPGAVVVCEDSRLTILDVGSIEQSEKVPRSEIQKLLESGKDAEVRRTIPGEHFEILYTFKVVAMSPTVMFDPDIRLVRKPGTSHRGETVAQLDETDSELRSRLLKFDPNTTYIQFVVYPDSYDAFRAVRSIVWQRGFEVFWIPIVTGEAIPFRSGPATSL